MPAPRSRASSLSGLHNISPRDGNLFHHHHHHQQLPSTSSTSTSTSTSRMRRLQLIISFLLVCVVFRLGMAVSFSFSPAAGVASRFFTLTSSSKRNNNKTPTQDAAIPKREGGSRNDDDKKDLLVQDYEKGRASLLNLLLEVSPSPPDTTIRNLGLAELVEKVRTVIMPQLSSSSPPFSSSSQSLLAQEAEAAAAPPALRGSTTTAATTTTTNNKGFPLPRWQRNLANTTLLILAHNRPQYLARCLAAVLKHYPPGPGLEGLPIVISEDGNDKGVGEVVESFQNEMLALSSSSSSSSSSVSVRHIHYPTTDLKHAQQTNGYARLAEHYKFALQTVFGGAGGDGDFEEDSHTDTDTDTHTHTHPVDQVIILEEDLEIAPDFFNYFGSFSPLLQKDLSLLAISAWNDNGQATHVKDTHTVTRTDFFPGLGWMLTKQLWVNELEGKWAANYWDDWLRDPAQRQGRQILAPEVCRSFHFGQKGTSNGQGSQLLEGIKLNDVYVDFDKLLLEEEEGGGGGELGHVMSEEGWEEWVFASVRRARKVEGVGELMQVLGNVDEEGGEEEEGGGGFYLTYKDLKAFSLLAKALGIYSDEKAGVPRMSYKGIVSVWVKGRRVHLVPEGHESIQGAAET